MKRLLALAAAISLSATAIAGATTDVTLHNTRGDVSYELHDNAAPHALALNASTALGSDDVARTGSQSMAEVTLPDSSTITMASKSVLKVDQSVFNSATLENHSHVVVFDGKVRFQVQHPNGAKANFTFTTPTAQIAVRGTIGDISVDPLDGVRLNVYGSGGIPIHVTMIDGQQFDVNPGQKIWMRWESGKLVGVVTPLTQAEVDRFEELGPLPAGLKVP